MDLMDTRVGMSQVPQSQSRVGTLSTHCTRGGVSGAFKHYAAICADAFTKTPIDALAQRRTEAAVFVRSQMRKHASTLGHTRRKPLIQTWKRFWQEWDTASGDRIFKPRLACPCKGGIPEEREPIALMANEIMGSELTYLLQASACEKHERHDHPIFVGQGLIRPYCSHQHAQFVFHERQPPGLFTGLGGRHLFEQLLVSCTDIGPEQVFEDGNLGAQSTGGVPGSTPEFNEVIDVGFLNAFNRSPPQSLGQITADSDIFVQRFGVDGIPSSCPSFGPKRCQSISGSTPALDEWQLRLRSGIQSLNREFAFHHLDASFGECEPGRVPGSGKRLPLRIVANEQASVLVLQCSQQGLAFSSSIPTQGITQARQGFPQLCYGLVPSLCRRSREPIQQGCDAVRLVALPGVDDAFDDVSSEHKTLHQCNGLGPWGLRPGSVLVLLPQRGELGAITLCQLHRPCHGLPLGNGTNMTADDTAAVVVRAQVAWDTQLENPALAALLVGQVLRHDLLQPAPATSSCRGNRSGYGYLLADGIATVRAGTRCLHSPDPSLHSSKPYRGAAHG